MIWARRNRVGLLGLVLALAAFAIGTEGYRSGVRRDEQERAISRRLARDEAESAERHRESVAALSEYVAVLRPLAFCVAGAAMVAGAWTLCRRQPAVWLSGAVFILAAGAVLLAHGSRPGPGEAPVRQGG